MRLVESDDEWAAPAPGGAGFDAEADDEAPQVVFDDAEGAVKPEEVAADARRVGGRPGAAAAAGRTATRRRRGAGGRALTRTPRRRGAGARARTVTRAHRGGGGPARIVMRALRDAAERAPIRTRRHRDEVVRAPTATPLRQGGAGPGSDSDASPPRRGRAGSDSDASPPRRGRAGSDSDASPPRRGRADSDASPPRRRARASTRRQRREQRAGGPERTSAKDGARRSFAPADKKASQRGARKMADGHSAGVLSGAEFKAAETKLREERRREAAAMDPSESGAHAATVYRDRRTGKAINLADEAARIEAEREKKAQEAREQFEWGRGTKQKEAEASPGRSSRPWRRALRRGARPDDPNMEHGRWDVIRDGDPMADYMRQSRAQEEEKATPAESRRPTYAAVRRPQAMDAFGIRPGYRWRRRASRRAGASTPNHAACGASQIKELPLGRGLAPGRACLLRAHFNRFFRAPSADRARMRISAAAPARTPRGALFLRAPPRTSPRKEEAWPAPREAAVRPAPRSRPRERRAARTPARGAAGPSRTAAAAPRRPPWTPRAPPGTTPSWPRLPCGPPPSRRAISSSALNKGAASSALAASAAAASRSAFSLPLAPTSSGAAPASPPAVSVRARPARPPLRLNDMSFSLAFCASVSPRSFGPSSALPTAWGCWKARTTPILEHDHARYVRHRWRWSLGSMRQRLQPRRRRDHDRRPLHFVRHGPARKPQPLLLDPSLRAHEEVVLARDGRVGVVFHVREQGTQVRGRGRHAPRIFQHRGLLVVLP